MANHGYCKRCWWCKMIENPGLALVNGKLVTNEGRGRCYNSNDSEGHYYHEVKGNDYCPNYTNRAREIKYGFETLEEWIERQGLDKEE